jgi:hypothetical protein
LFVYLFIRRLMALFKEEQAETMGMDTVKREGK